MYHNNKIIFKLHFLINLILPKSIVHINSCPKDICICKKIRITRTIIPYFISFFFHERSIHALYFFEYLVQRVSTGTLFSGGNERRDNVTRLAHHHDLDTNATWQTGYIFPLMNESCTRERRRATLPAAFSAMSPRILNVGCQYREGLPVTQASFEPILVLRDGNNSVCDGMEFQSVAVFHNTGNGGNPSKIRMQTLE